MSANTAKFVADVEIEPMRLLVQYTDKMMHAPTFQKNFVNNNNNFFLTIWLFNHLGIQL